MEYSKVFSNWRELYKTEWNSYTEHLFVEKIGDGTLPKIAFLTYLKQDYIFLKHFSRAWGLAIVKSDSITEMKCFVSSFCRFGRTVPQKLYISYQF